MQRSMLHEFNSGYKHFGNHSPKPRYRNTREHALPNFELIPLESIVAHDKKAAAEREEPALIPHLGHSVSRKWLVEQCVKHGLVTYEPDSKVYVVQSPLEAELSGYFFIFLI